MQVDCAAIFSAIKSSGSKTMLGVVHVVEIHGRSTGGCCRVVANFPWAYRISNSHVNKGNILNSFADSKFSTTWTRNYCTNIDSIRFDSNCVLLL